MKAEESLRERSKARRRAAIQFSAMRLFAERGYDGATIADIADDAQVAPRTVTLYFPSKLELALSRSDDVAARLGEAFRANPGAAFTDVVDLWLREEMRAADPELDAMTSAMYEANPELQAAAGARLSQITSVAGAALLAEMDLDPDSPMAAIATATVIAAVSAHLAAGTGAHASLDGHHAFMRFLRGVVAAGRAV